MDKVELRRAVIARRDALDLDVRAAMSAVICARLVELLDRLGAAAPHTVAVYAAMGSEVDPAAFAAAAAKRGWRVAYPCMFSAIDAAACGQRMCMRAVAADDASAAPFIAHPTRVFAAVDIDNDRFPIVPAEALDMVVVPLVAFDRAGARLGYGGGCYDRYLPMLSPACQIIGIAFDEQRVDHVPNDAHDLPLPHIISA
ncbi:5-formyltetrahydrofolate cyclo-ligase [Collinsella aerofaciens]|uniref:5-formyltetrahydrofolate cyclo-ligase n=1 Tax=Collinsella aerofaciens TaxID=74426 RepID=UPI0018ABF855|nr:5-formyltetrahydrofolate cyclo-ligase [Collinsella aerofaciens]MDB1857453.1 5-formyltetrahydrofolate cyclo-ligase [Collinsella aerofaciens]